MVTRWVGTDGMDSPRAVKCAAVGYPHRDADGSVQYENTHFDTEAEAWESIRRSAAAQVELDGAGVEQARVSLREAEGRGAEAAARFSRVESSFRLWCSRQSTPAPTSEERGGGE